MHEPHRIEHPALPVNMESEMIWSSRTIPNSCKSEAQDSNNTDSPATSNMNYTSAVIVRFHMSPCYVVECTRYCTSITGSGLVLIRTRLAGFVVK